jgi:Fur family ferric uptake transcriptional regulator
MKKNRLLYSLRKNGYKRTPQRKAVIKVLAESPGQLTPEEIYQKVRLENPEIGLVTVYRTLGLLDELNLVCRIHTPEGCRGYLLRKPDTHHHHLVCSDCGYTVPFNECNLGGLEGKLAQETGFSIEGHLLELHGRCRDCSQKINN